MPINVLLVEDSPVDIRFTHEAFRAINPSIHFHEVSDGTEAMAFLQHREPYREAPRPSLILLDLNLPKMGGCEFLTEVKADESLKGIPVVVLTTSDEEEVIAKAYRLQASCYLRKPTQLDDFENLVKNINKFWLSRVRFPGTP